MLSDNNTNNFSNNVNTDIKFAIYYLRSKNFFQAIQFFKRGFKENPGLIILYKEKFLEAVKGYRSTLKNKPVPIGDYKSLNKNSKENKQENSPSFKTVDTFIPKNIYNSDYYVQVGNYCFNELKYDKAIVHFNKAIQINPSCEEAYASLGSVYFELEDYEAAIDQYKKALTLNLNNEQVKNHLLIAKKIFDINKNI